MFTRAKSLRFWPDHQLRLKIIPSQPLSTTFPSIYNYITLNWKKGLAFKWWLGLCKAYPDPCLFFTRYLLSFHPCWVTKGGGVARGSSRNLGSFNTPYRLRMSCSIQSWQKTEWKEKRRKVRLVEHNLLESFFNPFGAKLYCYVIKRSKILIKGRIYLAVCS